MGSCPRGLTLKQGAGLGFPPGPVLSIYPVAVGHFSGLRGHWGRLRMARGSTVSAPEEHGLNAVEDLFGRGVAVTSVLLDMH